MKHQNGSHRCHLNAGIILAVTVQRSVSFFHTSLNLGPRQCVPGDSSPLHKADKRNDTDNASVIFAVAVHGSVQRRSDRPPSAVR